MKAKKKRKYYSIMVIPHETGTPRSFQISTRVVRMLCAAGIVLLAAAAVFLANQGKLISLARKASEYEQENQELLRKNALILELAERMERLEVLYDQIAGMFGASAEMPQVPADSGALAGEASPSAAGVSLPGLDAGKVPGSLIAPIPEPEDARPSAWPLTALGYVTRRFGDLRGGHAGIDIAVPSGTPVKVTGDGTVVEARYDPVYGNYVLIDHGSGFSTFYAHNTRLLVSEGQRVEKDEIIAFSGTTGESTAPHLHYEIRKEGVAVDPQQYLR
jgi:murein DD-endopeptidase MepM/ murein hydrolase activator NlpD